MTVEHFWGVYVLLLIVGSIAFGWVWFAVLTLPMAIISSFVMGGIPFLIWMFFFLICPAVAAIFGRDNKRYDRNDISL